jgi:DNA modification methylase
MLGAKEIKWQSVDKLIPYAKNARTHSDEQVAQIAGSIKEFGFNNPVLVDKEGLIIAGHGRLMAARKLGMDKVPVVELDHLTEAQRKAYVLADNRIALNSGWDTSMLSLELQDLKDDIDLSLLGFDPDELDQLLNPVEETEGLTDEDAVPETPVEPKTKLGDIYILGNHRLMCGDSTSITDVEKLMDGQKADMVFTDPPYNIGFSGTMSSTSKNGVLQSYITENAKHRPIENDKKAESEFYDFISQVLSIIQIKCKGAWYISFGSANLHELLRPIIDIGLKYKSIIIWVKNQSPMGGGAYRRKYEPIVYGNFSGDFYGKPYAEDDVWEFDRTKKNDLHPTMKPLELVKNALSHGSKSGDIVLDLFGGSGSTMIASEEIGRKARLMELDPKYCDVIVKRWENFTGKKAELVELSELEKA